MVHGSRFLRFQWDILAVESGALGVLLALSQLPHFIETRRICAALACQCVTLCQGRILDMGRAEKNLEGRVNLSNMWENLGKLFGNHDC